MQLCAAEEQAALRAAEAEAAGVRAARAEAALGTLQAAQAALASEAHAYQARCVLAFQLPRLVACSSGFHDSECLN